MVTYFPSLWGNSCCCWRWVCTKSYHLGNSWSTEISQALADTQPQCRQPFHLHSLHASQFCFSNWVTMSSCPGAGCSPLGDAQIATAVTPSNSQYSCMHLSLRHQLLAESGPGVAGCNLAAGAPMTFPILPPASLAKLMTRSDPNLPGSAPETI